MFQEIDDWQVEMGREPTGTFFDCLSFCCCLKFLSTRDLLISVAFWWSTGPVGGGFSSRGAQASLPSNGILPSHHHSAGFCVGPSPGKLRWELSLSFTCCKILTALGTLPLGTFPIFLIIYSDSNPISFSQQFLQCWHFRKQPPPLSTT